MGFMQEMVESTSNSFSLLIGTLFVRGSLPAPPSYGEICEEESGGSYQPPVCAPKSL